MDEWQNEAAEEMWSEIASQVGQDVTCLCGYDMRQHVVSDHNTVMQEAGGLAKVDPDEPFDGDVSDIEIDE